VGGIKEKVLAAKRAGMKEVILPERNRGDLEDLTEEARASLKFSFVTEIPQALALALKEKPGAKGSPKGRRKGAVKRKTR
jgi:ATP-dependent Lon protease